jgi:PAS domain S-box-containing protein
MRSPRSAPNLFTNTYVFAAILLAAAFWVLESMVHVAVFREGTFHSQLFTLDPHEIWKRLLFAALIILFGVYAQHGINVRRRTEAALRTSEQKYRTLIEKAMNPVVLFDNAGRFLEFNQATLDFFQLADNALRSRTYGDLGLPQQYPSLYPDAVFRPRLGRSEIDFRVNGGSKSMVLNIVPFSLEDSTTPFYYGIGQDITERKQAEQNLRLAHEELNQIFQTASSAMRVISRDFRVLKVNQGFADLSGVDRDDAIGTKCFEMFPGDRCHTDECPLHCVLRGASQIEYELSKTRSDGSTVTCLLTARPFFDADGRAIAVVESFKDITELSRVQAELRTERDKLRHILFQQAEGVSILRTDHTIEYQNKTLRQHIGDCQGVPCYRAFRGADHPCDPCHMHRALAQRRLQRRELDAAGGRTYEHTYTPFRDTDGQEKVVLSRRDITEVIASQAAAIRSEQMAAVGELAAGVAHEINNPMNGIINYAQMLVNRARDHREVRDIAGRIVKEGDRVAGIVASLLSFARRDADRRTVASIRDLLNESLTLIGAQMRNDGISLEVDVPADLPNVLCVEQEVQQVFLNVLNNARYALNRKYAESANEGKRIQISAGTEDVGERRFVRITIRDYGTGIPAEILDKITHPFFSTKPKGEGTGLGLSISSDIILKNAGHLLIESQEGEYTMVNIDLPEIAAIASAESA